MNDEGVCKTASGYVWSANYITNNPCNNPLLERGNTVLLLLLLLPLCHAQGPPLDSKTDWTGELWPNRILLILEN